MGKLTRSISAVAGLPVQLVRSGSKKNSWIVINTYFFKTPKSMKMPRFSDRFQEWFVAYISTQLIHKHRKSCVFSSDIIVINVPAQFYVCIFSLYCVVFKIWSTVLYATRCQVQKYLILCWILRQIPQLPLAINWLEAFSHMMNTM